MANAVEKLNTIEIGDIEKVNTLDDDAIEDINTLEFAGVTIPAWAGTRAVYGGGTQSSNADLNRIQYKTVGASANTVDFGDLQTNRSKNSSAGSNQTRGIFAGGLGLSSGTSGSLVYGVSDTDYITIGSTGNGTDFGDLNFASSYGQAAGASNGTLLFAAGGYGASISGSTNAMEYFTIASTGNGTDAGNISVTLNGHAATNGDTRYIIVAGYNSTTGENIDVLEYNDFSTSANCTDFGDTSVTSTYNAAAATSIRAVFHIPVGYDGSAYVYGDSLEYVTVASTGNTSDFGDLDTGRINAVGLSDGTTGEYSGGNVSGGGSSTNIIDGRNLVSTGDASDIGDLLEANQDPGGLSGS